METSNPTLNTVANDPDWRGNPVDSQNRFLNLNHPFVPSLWNVIRWKLQRNPYHDEKKIELYNPAIDKSADWLNGDKDVIVWFGHASFYMRINGIRLIIDPVFGSILTVKRKSGMPVNPALITNLDYVLLSHDHRDHCDKASLRLLALKNPGVNYLSGLGSGKMLKKFTGSAKIQTAGWYQQFDTKPHDLTITFVPSRHWSRRGLLDTNTRLWGGFVIQAGKKTIFFSGDSGYDTHYKEIAQIFDKFDYAILGIGAYLPRWFMHPMHQSPVEALQAFKDLRAKQFIPMHYGTFDLSDEPMNKPLADLEKEARELNLKMQMNTLTIGHPLNPVFS